MKAFEKASLSGEYYESFNVNSKNCTEKSTGTRAWIADCHRLLDCCTTQARKGDPVDVRQAFEIIFGLLDYIDDCLVDVIFFADEAGSWQVGVDWNKVLPSWFGVLSATAGPEEYAERITVLLEHHYNSESEKMLSVARRKGTPQQRKAISDIVGRNAGQRPQGRIPERVPVLRVSGDQRPLSAQEMSELRSYSTRARITATSFVSHYERGSFKGDGDVWMEK